MNTRRYMSSNIAYSIMFIPNNDGISEYCSALSNSNILYVKKTWIPDMMTMKINEIL